MNVDIYIRQFLAQKFMTSQEMLRGFDTAAVCAMLGAHTIGEGLSMGEAVTAGAIARVLHESQRQMIARALKVLGPERCVEILVATLVLTHQGGLWLKDGSRKRSMGGVFLELCRQRSTPEEKRAIFR